MKYNKVKLNKPLVLRHLTIILLFFFLNLTAFAQQTPTPTPTPKKETEGEKVEQALEDIFSVKKRNSTVTNTADFGNVGVLQIGYSYGGYYRGQGFRSQDSGTMTVDFTATEKIGFEFEMDTVASQKDSSFIRTTGKGDAHLTTQIDILDESETSPSFAASYFVKLPLANVDKGLGSGRVDHKITVLVSKTIRGTNIDFNSALLINGKQGEKGFVTGGEYSLAFSRDLTKRFNLLGEIFGETKDADQPKGLFASGVGNYQITKKMSLNFGVTVGLTPNSPRFGLTFGTTFTVGNLYGNH